MFRKAKKAPNGFAPKKRTRKEVETEYANTAIQAGHQARLISQKQKEVEAMQAEVSALVAKLEALNLEALKLPPEAPEAQASAPTSEPVLTQTEAK